MAAPRTDFRASSPWLPLDEAPPRTIVQLRTRRWRMWFAWCDAAGRWSHIDRPDTSAAPVRFRRACSLGGFA